ncbi:MAG: hypothetical protein JO148_13885, partial [Acidimicrobiia bacterium]|nr:hypothetical protein [Acidimicrobiia bacterium]
VAALLVLAVTVGPALIAAAAGLPYSDPNANGLLTFCDQSAKPMDHGSISVPAAWTAVSAAPAPAGYGVAGGTATLFAYQPRQGVAPSEWSGDSLSASSRYTDPAHPAAKVTSADPPLREFVNAYPPRWAGLVELRLYLGAPDQPPLTNKYAAADIQITGDTWRLVRGGSDCSGVQATSIEELLPSQDPTKTVAQAAAASPSGNGPSSNGGPGSGAAVADPVPNKAATGSVTVEHASTSNGVARWLRLAIPAVALAFGVALLIRRRINNRVPSQATI